MNLNGFAYKKGFYFLFFLKEGSCDVDGKYYWFDGDNGGDTK